MFENEFSINSKTILYSEFNDELSPGRYFYDAYTKTFKFHDDDVKLGNMIRVFYTRNKNPETIPEIAAKKAVKETRDMLDEVKAQIILQDFQNKLEELYEVF